MENINLEQKFISDLKKNCRPIITIGVPQSGKTFLALKYLTYALNNNLYDEYHLVLPQFSGEQNDSYSFIKNFTDKIFIYDEYDNLIVDKILKIRQKKNIFFMVDDATGAINFHRDTSLVKLISTARHGKGCCVWIIAHASKKIFSKPVRGCVKYIFISSIESEEMLKKDIYDDFASMFYKKQGKCYDDFFNDFTTIMESHKYGMILIARRMESDESCALDIDYDVNQWSIYNEKPQITSKKPSKIPKVIPNETKSVSKYNFPKMTVN